MVLREEPSWDVYKIVVFVVIAHIKTNPVEDAVVGIGFLALFKDKVFVDEVACNRMEAIAKEGTQQKIPHSSPTEIIDHQQISYHNNGNIDPFPTTRAYRKASCQG